MSAPSDLTSAAGGRPRVDVVGAGVAGLATAVALYRRGWRVRVLERAGPDADAGGGLGITPNGLRALDWLGVGDRVRSLSIEQASGGLRRPDGQWIARSRLDFVRERYGDGIRALLRGELLALLRAQLPREAVQYRWRVDGLDVGGERTMATLLGPDRAGSCDLMVLADGAQSPLRRTLLPEHLGLRSAGCVSWRALSACVPAESVVPAETWGAGERLALLPLPDGRVHCSMMLAGTLARFADRTPIEVLLERFGRWHHPIPELLGGIDSDALFCDEITELIMPLQRRHRGRAVLVGDAAHAMTPNVGAANLALEDAVELAARVGPGADGDEIDRALDEYGRVRRRRTASLATLSRRAGRIALWHSPIATAVRNGLVRAGGLAPEVLTARSLDAMFGWRPPSPAPTPRRLPSTSTSKPRSAL